MSQPTGELSTTAKRDVQDDAIAISAMGVGTRRDTPTTHMGIGGSDCAGTRRHREHFAWRRVFG